ncbi:MAG: energy transducer TonB [Deltaproteobacteria bacterium]|nr:energy transducer TonB [Deltaproteobacteria bacterium]
MQISRNGPIGVCRVELRILRKIRAGDGENASWQTREYLATRPFQMFFACQNNDDTELTGKMDVRIIEGLFFTGAAHPQKPRGIGLVFHAVLFSLLLHLLTLGMLYVVVKTPLVSMGNEPTQGIIQITLSPPGKSIGLSQVVPPSVSAVEGENTFFTRAEKSETSAVKDTTRMGSPPDAKSLLTERKPGDVTDMPIVSPHTPQTAGSVTSKGGMPGNRDCNTAGGELAPVTRPALRQERPRYLDVLPPVYPAEARIRGHEGVALIGAEILPNGRVGQITIRKTSGYTALDRAAMKAVRAWRFEPARHLGAPVAVIVDIPVRFSLKDDWHHHDTATGPKGALGR